MSLANSFATIASGGMHCEPFPVTSIETADGKQVALKRTKRCNRVLKPETAAGTIEVMDGVLRGGTASGRWQDPHPAVGKTGTTEDNNQLWFAGFTRQLSTAVWYGYITPANSYGQLKSLGGGAFGGGVSAPMWAQIMKAGSADLPVVQFPRPGSAVVNGNLSKIPDVGGRSIAEAKSILKKAGFDSYQGPAQYSNYPVGTAAGTDPAKGAVKGTSVAIVTSLGPAPKPKVTPSPGAKPTPGAKPGAKPGATPRPGTKP